ncbi:hypothetical protein VAE130_600773 [Vibrio aestuarianus]|uniref:Uncharacterized protein n=1 Tax=Vibrio aestuarianus TaxID=28171 RepID=A0ABM9FJ98_9VIBR|nr:hypothetical protein VAE063_1010245 [Vibrio aestuarianus]CAH8224914.1 hypothetical protein VAE308_1270125 [Vibrio aestuarianus]CAH8229695.1 hypothetical protein VAE055_420776 [Vibrio aestuarianus]CAH8230101.1 hypothetical protein VAE115_380250 [Vibrio aestuarianus]CAH8230153.1 hypothetical protein VAE130_600773 [Vibrio aestuarianus]
MAFSLIFRDFYDFKRKKLQSRFPLSALGIGFGRIRYVRGRLVDGRSYLL